MTELKNEIEVKKVSGVYCESPASVVMFSKIIFTNDLPYSIILELLNP